MAAIRQGLKKLRNVSKSNLFKNYPSEINIVKSNANNLSQGKNSDKKTIQGVSYKRIPEDSLPEQNHDKNTRCVCKNDGVNQSKNQTKSDSHIHSNLLRHKFPWMSTTKKYNLTSLNNNGKKKELKPVLTTSPNCILSVEKESIGQRFVHYKQTNVKGKESKKSDLSKSKRFPLEKTENKKSDNWENKKQINLHFSDPTIIKYPEPLTEMEGKLKYFQSTTRSIVFNDRQIGISNSRFYIVDPIIKSEPIPFKTNKRRIHLWSSANHYHTVSLIKSQKKIGNLYIKPTCQLKISKKTYSDCVMETFDCNDQLGDKGSKNKSCRDLETHSSINQKICATEQVKNNSKHDNFMYYGSQEDKSHNQLKSESTVRNLSQESKVDSPTLITNNKLNINSTCDFITKDSKEDQTKNLLNLKSLKTIYSTPHLSKKEYVHNALRNNYNGYFQVIGTNDSKLMLIKLQSQPDILSPENIDCITLHVTEKLKKDSSLVTELRKNKSQSLNGLNSIKNMYASGDNNKTINSVVDIIYYKMKQIELLRNDKSLDKKGYNSNKDNKSTSKVLELKCDKIGFNDSRYIIDKPKSLDKDVISLKNSSKSLPKLELSGEICKYGCDESKTINESKCTNKSNAISKEDEKKQNDLVLNEPIEVINIKSKQMLKKNHKDTSIEIKQVKSRQTLEDSQKVMSKTKKSDSKNKEINSSKDNRILYDNIQPQTTFLTELCKDTYLYRLNVSDALGNLPPFSILNESDTICHGDISRNAGVNVTNHDDNLSKNETNKQGIDKVKKQLCNVNREDSEGVDSDCINSNISIKDVMSKSFKTYKDDRNDKIKEKSPAKISNSMTYFHVLESLSKSFENKMMKIRNIPHLTIPKAICSTKLPSSPELEYVKKMSPNDLSLTTDKKVSSVEMKDLKGTKENVITKVEVKPVSNSAVMIMMNNAKSSEKLKDNHKQNKVKSAYKNVTNIETHNKILYDSDIPNNNNKSKMAGILKKNIKIQNKVDSVHNNIINLVKHNKILNESDYTNNIMADMLNKNAQVQNKSDNDHKIVTDQMNNKIILYDSECSNVSNKSKMDGMLSRSNTRSSMHIKKDKQHKGFIDIKTHNKILYDTDYPNVNIKSNMAGMLSKNNIKSNEQIKKYEENKVDCIDKHFTNLVTHNKILYECDYLNANNKMVDVLNKNKWDEKGSKMYRTHNMRPNRMGLIPNLSIYSGKQSMNHLQRERLQRSLILDKIRKLKNTIRSNPPPAIDILSRNARFPSSIKGFTNNAKFISPTNNVRNSSLKNNSVHTMTKKILNEAIFKLKSRRVDNGKLKSKTVSLFSYKPKCSLRSFSQHVSNTQKLKPKEFNLLRRLEQVVSNKRTLTARGADKKGNQYEQLTYIENESANHYRPFRTKQEGPFAKIPNIIYKSEKEVNEYLNDIKEFQTKYKKLHATNYIPFLKMERNLKTSYTNKEYEETNTNGNILLRIKMSKMRPIKSPYLEFRNPLDAIISKTMYRTYREHLEKNK